MQILITTVCSLLAAIGGAFIVHRLTRSREHAVWVRDSRIREWQELLESLTKAYMTLLSEAADSRVESIMADKVKKHEAMADVDTVLSTRIFIADDVSNLEVRPIWAASVTDFLRDRHKAIFQERFQGLRINIVEKAQQAK
jgi:hypothetical protein